MACSLPQEVGSPYPVALERCDACARIEAPACGLPVPGVAGEAYVVLCSLRWRARQTLIASDTSAGDLGAVVLVLGVKSAAVCRAGGRTQSDGNQLCVACDFPAVFQSIRARGLSIGR